MATPSTPRRKRVGDYNPDLETGETLDGIADTEVIIADVTFDRRNGRNGRYTLSVITLDNGRKYHTGSSVVAERLASLFGVSLEQLNDIVDRGDQPSKPVNTFPVDAMFSRERSQSNPSQSFWTVS